MIIPPSIVLIVLIITLALALVLVLILVCVTSILTLLLQLIKSSHILCLLYCHLSRLTFGNIVLSFTEFTYLPRVGLNSI